MVQRYKKNRKPLQLIYNGTKYTYITNLQGDVVQIRDASKKIVAEYAYNAWGEVIYVSGTEIKDVNPLRYRGYYYDTETGLYYLNSRYYDPKTCRFINADDTDDTDVLAIDQDNLLQYNPLNNAKHLKNIILSDSRWLATEGWIKMERIYHSWNGTKVIIHFVYNTITGKTADFKFK